MYVYVLLGSDTHSQINRKTSTKALQLFPLPLSRSLYAFFCSASDFDLQFQYCQRAKEKNSLSPEGPPGSLKGENKV